MDTIVNFVIGSASSPVEVAVSFLLFCIFLDSIFNIIFTLMDGVRK